MNNPTNLWKGRKETRIQKESVWSEKADINAVTEKLVDQLTDSVDATIVQTRGNMVVYY